MKQLGLVQLVDVIVIYVTRNDLLNVTYHNARALEAEAS